MIGRFTHLFKKRAEKGAMRKKAEAMFSSKKEVKKHTSKAWACREPLDGEQLRPVPVHRPKLAEVRPKPIRLGRVAVGGLLELV